MHGLLPRAVAFLALLAAGCASAPRFVPPRPTEAHALVKLRLVYHEYPVSTLDEEVRYRGLVVETPEAGTLQVPRTWALRVPPGPAEWTFDATFSHIEQRLELRPHQVAEQYPCGTITSGTGTGSFSTTRYCTRYRTEYHNQMMSYPVVDAACGAGVFHSAVQGFIYLVQFDFYSAERCQARCFVQHPQPDGTFRLEPCPMLEGHAPSR